MAIRNSPARPVLVTGAVGQIGSELVLALRKRYGEASVISSDLRLPLIEPTTNSGPHVRLDCRDMHELLEIVLRYDVGTIYHLAAMLSATAEADPQKAWDLNMTGLYNVLEVARECRCKVFFPSTIGAFGPTTPKHRTPQVTTQRPVTMYGVTKVAGELLSDYYASRFQVDTRGLRLPGLISYATPPGGGTTDYAIEMFHRAVDRGRYNCFLAPDSSLDLMYMPDAVAAIIAVMEVDAARLRYRNAYNVTAMSVTPSDLAEEIRKHLPRFVVTYEVDRTRQSIADSWPDSLDDSAAREDWDWCPRYNLAAMVEDMLVRIRPPLVATETSRPSNGSEANAHY